ncbi:MAG: hypothetical protein WD626_05875 [Bauldia sp.]
MRAAATTIAALALAGCQSAGTSTTGTFAEAQTLFLALQETMTTCWFSGDLAFAGYVYTPEINAGTPRILIVPKGEPTALPLLVVETKGRAAADYYGPLLASADGRRIGADLDRWIRGGTGCG